MRLALATASATMSTATTVCPTEASAPAAASSPAASSNTRLTPVPARRSTAAARRWAGAGGLLGENVAQMAGDQATHIVWCRIPGSSPYVFFPLLATR
jgi:hypothetical protein